MNRMIKGMVVTALMMAAPLVSAGQWVNVQNGLVSTSFSQTPLNTGLKELSKATGVQFLLDENLTGTLDVNVRGVPSEAAIRRVISSFSHAVFYAASADGTPQIARVKLFRPGAENSARYQLIAETAVAAKSADSVAGQASVSGALVSGNAQQPAEEAEASAGGVSGAAAVDAAVAAARPGEVQREIAKLQSELMMLRRKAVGTRLAIDQEMAQLRRKIASSGTPDPEDIQKLPELDGQKVKCDQLCQQQIIAAQKALEDAVDKGLSVKSPADLQKEALARQSRQTRGGTVSVSTETQEGGGESRRNRNGV